MLGNEAEVNLLKISRLLTPENRVNLLGFVHLGYTAENSVRKSLDYGYAADSAFGLNQKEYSCGNNSRRRKK